MYTITNTQWSFKKVAEEMKKGTIKVLFGIKLDNPCLYILDLEEILFLACM